MSSGGPPRSCCSNHRCGGSRPRDSLALPALELAGQRVGLPHPGPTAPLLAKITSDEETVRIEPATRDRSAAQVPHDRFRHRNAASGTSASATFQSSGPGGSRLCVGGPAQPRGRARHPVVGHAVAQRPTEPAGRAHRPVEEAGIGQRQPRARPQRHTPARTRRQGTAARDATEPVIATSGDPTPVRRSQAGLCPGDPKIRCVTITELVATERKRRRHSIGSAGDNHWRAVNSLRRLLMF